MGKNIDDIKGRLEETTGDVTGDKDLERKGKIDRISGKAKDAADELPVNHERRGMVEDKIEKVKDNVREAVERA
ncbi:MAG TPA: CsbD family protein [Actinomycetota bacterium]|nr:CsbD family protein [Actinomycetota bacterium]